MNRPAADLTPDRDLAARCRRGEPDAQRTLYETTVSRIFRLLIRMTHSPQQAEDLAQETYLRAFSAIASFDGRSSLHTWLYRIAVNEALQWARRAKPALLDPANAETLPAQPDECEVAADRMDIEHALATLEPLDRAILLLRYQEGLDYRTIAEVTQVALGTVASRLNRARFRLRELLRDFGGKREESPPGKHPMRKASDGAVGVAPSVEGTGT